MMRNFLFLTPALLASVLLVGCGGGDEDIDAESADASEAISSKAAAVKPAAAAVSLPTDKIFAPTSFWYQQIPTKVALHANSAGFVADFLRQKKAYYGTVGINLKSYASPIYTTPSNMATARVMQSRCQGQPDNPSLTKQWAEVPIPSYAAPADGTDGEMTIYQPSSDTIWEFWQAKKANGQWIACHGGRMQQVSQSDGRWDSFYGTTATGLPFLGGQITAEELSRGEIRHAIGISLPEVEAANVVSWPAKRSDGANPKRLPNRIPEGLRFRLDPSVNVDALPMSAAGKIIAKAAQKYGFIVWDRSGAIMIRAQNPKSYTSVGKVDPYPALFSNKPQYAVMEGLPWDKLQFLPMNYGQP